MKYITKKKIALKENRLFKQTQKKKRNLYIKYKYIFYIVI